MYTMVEITYIFICFPYRSENSKTSNYFIDIGIIIIIIGIINKWMATLLLSKMNSKKAHTRILISIECPTPGKKHKKNYKIGLEESSERAIR